MYLSLKQIGFVCVIFLALSHARANSISITTSGDTAIYGQSPNDNAGGNDSFGVGANTNVDRSRGLLKFDLSQIPANASIQSVTLTLTVVKVPNAAPSAGFDLHRMLVGWTEGTGVGGGEGGRIAIAGEVTWNHRVHPSTNWSAVGAAAPVDFVSTVSGSLPIQPMPLGTYTFVSTPQMVADVKQWLTTPATNFGWLLATQSESTARTLRFFASREDTTVANRPVLTIQYVIPTTPPIKSIQRVGSTIQITFTALGGQPYTVEYRDSPITGAWTTLTNVPPQGSTGDVVVTDPNPPLGSDRSYRITTTFN